MDPKIYILAQENERYRFVCEFIFSEVLSIPYQIISSPQESDPKIPVISHGYSNIKNSLIIPDCGLLKKSSYETILIPKTGEGDSLKLFSEEENDFGYDLFAMTFFLISRYEEYNNSNRDIHERFIPQKSCLFSADIPFIAPILDYRILELGEILKQKWGIIATPKELAFRLTVDIDIAWKYKAKGFYRSFGALLIDLSKIHINSIFKRLSILLKLKKDPFDTYQLFTELSHSYHIPLHFFWLLAKKRSKYDRNAIRSSSSLKKLILNLCNHAENGIHYSYSSFDDPQILKDEIEVLRKTIRVSSGRAHYLRFSFPETPKQLLNNGISEDFSLGYASIPGFRAGTTHPFPFFDITSNSRTKLMLHSTAFMDGTVVDYLNLCPDEAEILFESLLHSAKQCGGEFTLLYHNETFCQEQRWEKWTPFFISLIEKISKVKSID